MEGISDIRIIGIDEQRPPKIRKEPYIDLVFKLSHKVPVEWCKSFNAMLSKHAASPKINEKDCLYIVSWVRNMDEIVPFLALLKEKIAECSQLYIERIERTIRDSGDANASLALQGGEQGKLNKIIESLDFSDNNSR